MVRQREFFFNGQIQETFGSKITQKKRIKLRVDINVIETRTQNLLKMFSKNYY